MLHTTRRVVFRIKTKESVKIWPRKEENCRLSSFPKCVAGMQLDPGITVTTAPARQRLLVVKHRAEIAHVEIPAARFTFVKMICLAQGRPADLRADDFPARDRRRHARNLGHAFVSLDLIGTSIVEP